METIRIAEAESPRFPGLLARVRAGVEVVIDDAWPAVKLSLSLRDQAGSSSRFGRDD